MLNRFQEPKIMGNTYFTDMIIRLRRQEEILLYNNIIEVTEPESKAAIEFLRKEYEQEALDHPYTVPEFDPAAAVWAAKTVYVTAQLMLYRENRADDLQALLPAFPGEITPSAVLSADLCLRFFPSILFQLKVIDTADALIPLLEAELHRWHYSGLQYPLETDKLDFTVIATNECLGQLYTNRIIDYKKIQLAKHPACKDRIVASLGLYADEFWKDLN